MHNRTGYLQLRHPDTAMSACYLGPCTRFRSQAEWGIDRHRLKGLGYEAIHAGVIHRYESQLHPW